jgi:hypothetical protein
MISARKHAACDSTCRSFIALGDVKEEQTDGEACVDEEARRSWMSSFTTGTSNMSDNKEAERA